MQRSYMRQQRRHESSASSRTEQPTFDRSSGNFNHSRNRGGNHQFFPIRQQRERRPHLNTQRWGRGQWVNRREEESGDRWRDFRKADRPLVPENKADLEKWIPRVMGPKDVVDIAKQAIEVTDAFIKFDSYLDRNKRFNSSNLDQLRQEQRMQQQEVQPNEYQELIAQCEANPDKFMGTQYCLKLVLGERNLREYVNRRAWTEQQLKEWNITTDWQMFDKKVHSDESLALAPPSALIQPQEVIQHDTETTFPDLASLNCEDDQGDVY